MHELIISLPAGYETRTGQGFFRSSGLRQRLALARALYGDPFVLVLRNGGQARFGDKPDVLKVNGRNVMQTASRAVIEAQSAGAAQ